jgi:hypothetical protein
VGCGVPSGGGHAGAFSPQAARNMQAKTKRVKIKKENLFMSTDTTLRNLVYMIHTLYSNISPESLL